MLGDRSSQEPLSVADFAQFADFTDFTDELFGRLARADQRRWAHAYLQALLLTPGKKTVRRLAATVSDSPTASQALHQFVNASPWDWKQVREDLSRQVERRARARAWVVAPAVLPKRGMHSCGVHRRFVAQEGRAVNCQLAVGAFLATDRGAMPVDWRLHLPESWLDSRPSRLRARIPDRASLRTPAGEALDLFDTAVRSGHFLPVVAHLGGHGDARELVAGLDARGADFLVAVPDSMPALLTPHLHPGVPVAHRRYRLFTDPRTGQCWLTNLVRRPAPELLALTGASLGVRSALDRLAVDFGLRDFEGRSFPGWHHHMTLLSAAYAYQALTREHPARAEVLARPA
ncbi:transposase [Streptomyces sp. NPDC047097]|uniref:IS701 family transposase n=1 Tax=Streptomyces sp. NPDC047097 TaxID=3155260 RepID=UPI0033EE3770